MTALEVINGKRNWSVEQGDCLEWLRSLPDDCLDLVFGSPPYELARHYLEAGKNLGIARKTEAWVAWMVEVFKECSRVCKGLVAFVVEGQTKQFKYSAGPLLLMADLHRAGFNLRKPPAFCRVGIPGSGGHDWLRNDYEFIVCTTRPGKLPWSDNTAMGHKPKWQPGGAMSNRNVEGKRKNEQDGPKAKARRDKGAFIQTAIVPDEGPTLIDYAERPQGMATCGSKGDGITLKGYDPPKLANPGNVIECLVGGGVMGNPLCHENEAPFPEDLATFFIRSFCPEGGIVGDPFSGSGTTAAVAIRWHRRAIACELRDSQVDLSARRIGTEQGMFQGV